jgi:hypothetical protein
MTGITLLLLALQTFGGAPAMPKTAKYLHQKRLSSQDTSAVVGLLGGCPALLSLKCRANGDEWVAYSCSHPADLFRRSERRFDAPAVALLRRRDRKKGRNQSRFPLFLRKPALGTALRLDNPPGTRPANPLDRSEQPLRPRSYPAASGKPGLLCNSPHPAILSASLVG